MTLKLILCTIGVVGILGILFILWCCCYVSALAEEAAQREREGQE